MRDESGLKIVGWYDTTSATEGSNASCRTAEVRLDEEENHEAVLGHDERRCGRTRSLIEPCWHWGAEQATLIYVRIKKNARKEAYHPVPNKRPTCYSWCRSPASSEGAEMTYVVPLLCKSERCDPLHSLERILDH